MLAQYPDPQSDVTFDEATMPACVGLDGTAVGETDGDADGFMVGDADTLGSGVTTSPEPPGIAAGRPGKLIGWN